MADELKTIKFQMMLSPSEAEAIDDWAFANRIKSRAEAIRRLVRFALLLETQSHDFATGIQEYSIELLEFIQHWLRENAQREDDPKVVDDGKRLMALIKNLEPTAMAARIIAEQGVAVRMAETVEDAEDALAKAKQAAETELAEFIGSVDSFVERRK